MADQVINVFINLNSNLEGKLGSATRAVDNFSRRADPAIRRANGAFAGLGKAIRGVGTRLGQFTKRWVTLATTIGTTAVIFKSISDAQKFGIAIAEIGTIFDGTDRQLRGIEQTILDLSEALGLPEVIAAKGFYQIISSDITDAAEAMVVLKEGTELATVGLADVKQTIDVLTSVIKAYQADVDTAARISEVLFKTVVKGKTTIPELATSLGQVLPIAAQLGISLEEVSASVATLTQGGIDTNVAIIQLRQAFNSLLKPSAEAATTLAKYNINVSAARVRTTGFRDVLEELREKIGDNTADLSKIFGNIRALIPVLALTGKQAEQFGKNLRFIGEESDLADEALQKFLDNPFKRFQRFFNTLRIRLRAVGEVFIKELSNQLDNLGFDNVINDLDTLFSGLEGAAKTAAKAIGGVFEQIGDFVENLGGVERAQQILEAFGRTISSAVNVAFQTAITLVLTFVEILARLPVAFAALENDFRNVFGRGKIGFFTGIEAGTEETVDTIRARFAPLLDVFEDLTERRRMFEEEAAKSGKTLPPPSGFVGVRRLDDSFTLALTKITAQGGSLEQVDQAIVDLEGQVKSVLAAMDAAPPTINSVANSFKPLAERLGATQKAVADVGDAWQDMRNFLNAPIPEKSVEDVEESLGRLLLTLGRLGAGGLLNSLGSDLAKTTIDLDNLTATSLKAQLTSFTERNEIDVEVGVSLLPEVERLGALGKLVDAFDDRAVQATLGLTGVDEAVDGLETVVGFLDMVEGEVVKIPLTVDEDAALEALRLVDDALSRIDGAVRLPISADTDEARRGLADLGGLLESLQGAEFPYLFDAASLGALDELLDSFDGKLVEIPFDLDVDSVSAGLVEATELLTAIVDLAGDIPFDIDVAATRSAILEVEELLESVGSTTVEVPLDLGADAAADGLLRIEELLARLQSASVEIPIDLGGLDALFGVVEELQALDVELPSLDDLVSVIDVLSGEDVTIPVGFDSDAALGGLQAVVRQIEGVAQSGVDVPFEFDVDSVARGVEQVGALLDSIVGGPIEVPVVLDADEVRDGLIILRGLFAEIQSGEIEIGAGVDIRAGVEALDDLVRIAGSTSLNVPFDLDVPGAREAVAAVAELLEELSGEAVQVPVSVDTTDARKGLDTVDALLERVRLGAVELPVGVDVEDAEEAIDSVRARLDALDEGATDLTLDLKLDTSKSTEDITRASELLKKQIEDTFGVILPDLGNLDTQGLETVFKGILDLSEQELTLLGGIPDTLREQVGVLQEVQGLRRAEFKSAILTLGADEKRREKLVKIFDLFQVAERQALTGFTSQQDALDKINRGLSVSIERQKETLRIANTAAREQAERDLEVGDIDTAEFEERLAAIDRTVGEFEDKVRDQIFGVSNTLSGQFKKLEGDADKLETLLRSAFDEGIIDEDEFADALEGIALSVTEFNEDIRASILNSGLTDDFGSQLRELENETRRKLRSLQSAFGEGIINGDEFADALEGIALSFTEFNEDIRASILNSGLTDDFGSQLRELENETRRRLRSLQSAFGEGIISGDEFDGALEGIALSFTEFNEDIRASILNSGLTDDFGSQLRELENETRRRLRSLQSAFGEGIINGDEFDGALDDIDQSFEDFTESVRDTVLNSGVSDSFAAQARELESDNRRLRRQLEVAFEMGSIDDDEFQSVLADIERSTLDFTEGVRDKVLNSGISDSFEAQARELEGTNEQLRRMLEEAFELGEIDATEFQSVLDDIERSVTEFTQSVRDTVLNSGISDSFAAEARQLESEHRRLKRLLQSAFEIGAIDATEFQSVLGDIERSVVEFNDRVKEDLLNQPGFELLGPVEDAFRAIEIRAKAAAIASTDFPDGIARTTEEVAELNAEFNKFFREQTSGFDAFLGGFSTGLAQIGDELGDTFTRGIQAATSAVEGFRGSFQSALSDLIAGTSSASEALDAFKESFALSLADSLSTALTDTVTSGILNILPGVGEAATEGAEALAAFTPAVEAIVASANTSSVALTGSATLLDTAGGVLLAAGQAQLAAVLAQEGAGVAEFLGKVGAAAFTGGATGDGSDPGPVADNETFASGGFSDRRGGFERLAAGGVKTTRTFAEIAEAGVPELVVPLPGNNRRVPVELKNPSAIVGGRGGGGGDRFVVQASIGLTFNNLDPKGAQQAVLAQMPGIMKGISATLENGSNRELALAVRRTAGGA